MNNLLKFDLNLDTKLSAREIATVPELNVTVDPLQSYEQIIEK